MTVIVPEAPADLTAEQLATLLNIKDQGDAERVFQLAITTVNRELTGAFRDVPPNVYDDLVRKVAGAIVGSRRRPAAGSGQLSRADQDAPGQPAPPRDYVGPIRAELALYVSPL